MNNDLKQYAFFFDLDGTILKHGKLPRRNKRALLYAVEQGHKIFINSGRGRANLPENIKDVLPWSGIVCGCSYVLCDDEVLFSQVMSKESLEKTVSVFFRDGIRATLEGEEAIYTINHHFKRDSIRLNSVEELLSRYNELKITKITIHANVSDAVKKELSAFATLVRFPYYCELLIKGNTKATGMEILRQKLNFPLENVVVFGDSLNDLDMFRYAPTSVAMKKSPAELKRVATIVAKSYVFGLAHELIKLSRGLVNVQSKAR